MTNEKAKRPVAGSVKGKGTKSVVATPARTGDSSLRKPGPLTLFGIKTQQQVPLILPREFHNYSNPLTDFSDLVVGSQVCVAGVPRSLVRVTVDALSSEASSEAAEIVAELIEEEGDAEIVAAATLATNSVSLDRAGFELVDSDGRNTIYIEFEVRTRADRTLVQKVRQGDAVYLYGELSRRPDGAHVIIQPELIAEQDRGRIYARYPSKSKRELITTAGGRNKKSEKAGRKPKYRTLVLYPLAVATLIQERLRLAIPACAGYLRDRLYLTEGPAEWRLLRLLGSPDITLEGTLWQAHQPRSVESGLSAVRALERLVAVEYLQRVHKDREDRLDASSAICVKQGAFPAVKADLLRHGGITMTAEQNAGAKEILCDLVSPYVMHRAISGDVGTGKTIVFGVVAATLARVGRLVVILEPRTALAHQVFQKLQAYWPDIRFQLVVGESGVLDLLTAGVIVGTTAIWGRILGNGHRPDLIIADEQQKLGVAQRNPFSDTKINLLEATATPIPRTQGLIEFGGLDVTELHACHQPKKIHTQLVEGREAIDAAYEEVIAGVRDRHQTLAVVYPLVSADDAEDNESLLSVKAAMKYWEGVFPNRVAIIHGQMDDAAKLAAIDRFERGAVDVLVGTIVLEVGLDFSKLDLMIIHYPERMGVATAHQLRGRLVRQGGEGWCWLACPDPLDEGRRTLFETMEHETDGFRLAYLDMLRRGFGDMRAHARQQSGAYDGFLPDRPPSVDDLTLALEDCQEWVGEERGARDLFDQPIVDAAFLEVPARRSERHPARGDHAVLATQLSLLEVDPSE